MHKESIDLETYRKPFELGPCNVCPVLHLTPFNLTSWRSRIRKPHHPICKNMHF